MLPPSSWQLPTGRVHRGPKVELGRSYLNATLDLRAQRKAGKVECCSGKKKRGMNFFLSLSWEQKKNKENREQAWTFLVLATHSSTLAWKIPWMEEPGRLQSLGSLRVRHDWATSLSLFTLIYWRRKWQPTPVFLPGESQGRGSRVGCRLWGRTESDTTEAT